MLARLFPTMLLIAAAHAMSGPPVFDVPRMPGMLNVDGKADEWQGTGFHTGNLLDPDLEMPPAGFSATARVAWDGQGLCVWVETRGGSGVEADQPGAIFEGSGIELFVSTAFHNGHTADDHRERNILQPLIAPGRDPRHPEPRVYIYDTRLPTLATAHPPACEHATRVQGNHVSHEIRIPWSQFELKPREGLTIGLQIHANDADSGGRRSQLRWNTAPGKGQTLRLAGPGERTASGNATARYENWQHIRVRMNARPDSVYQISANGGSRPLGTDDKGDGKLDLPMPPWGEKGTPILVSDVTGAPIAWIELPAANSARQQAVDALPLLFSGDNVFCGETFPALDTPPAALIDPETLNVRFFNAKCEEVVKPDLPGRYFALVGFLDKGGRQVTRRIDLFRSRSEIDPHLTGSDEALAAAAGLASPFTEWDRKLLQSARRHPGDDFKKRIFNRAATLSALHERGETPARVMTSRLNAWYRLERKLGIVEPVRHLALLPPADAKPPGGKWPVVVFLHGTGGHNEDAARKEPIRTCWQERADRDFILLQPLAPRGTSWVPDQIVDWLDDTLPAINGDPERVVLTGFSMGGIGTWNIACAHPDRFAAYVPLASVGEPAPVSAAKGRPLWCFHGRHDAMPWQPARQWVNDLRKLDPAADARFTLLENTDHTNTSERAYSRHDLMEWIHSHLAP